MFHYIYITTNSISGKKYIGKHSYKSLQNSYIGSGHRLKVAIQKYGRSFFTKDIIGCFDTEDEAYEAEEILINNLNAVKDPNYYNATRGGRGSKAGRSLPEEHRRKISENHRRYQSKETRKKISDSHKGKPSWHKGKKKSEETKQKMKDGNSHHPCSPETKLVLSDLNKGSSNPNFGKRWITDGNTNRKVTKYYVLIEGWRYGRMVDHILGFRGAH